MKLVVDETFLRKLATAGKKNKAFAYTIAKEIFTQKDRLALARLLLTREVAASLLAEELLENPTKTFRALREMPDRPRGTGGRRWKGAGRDTARMKSGGGVELKVKAAEKRGRKKRVAPANAAVIKDRIRQFLKQNPGSGKKEIFKAVKVPKVTTYNRIMAELKQAGEVWTEGEKRNMIYFLM